MLIGFIALIAALNGVFSAIFGLSFQKSSATSSIRSLWIMGIPKHEALQVGSIMATKLVSNEFVAMMELQKVSAELSPRSTGILSVFWCPSPTSPPSASWPVRSRA